jgi:hypothetical protein
MDNAKNLEPEHLLIAALLLITVLRSAYLLWTGQF